MLTVSQYEALTEVALALQVPPDWLYRLINFESNWKPEIKNPVSSARGLIQFTDTTAKGMGYRDSLDLVTKHPTIESQLLGPVMSYLSRQKPFTKEGDLYLSVFYPASKAWPLDKEYPLEVQQKNPGIKTPRDYIEKVTGLKTDGSGLLATLFFAGAVLAILYKGFKK